MILFCDDRSIALIELGWLNDKSTSGVNMKNRKIVVSFPRGCLAAQKPCEFVRKIKSNSCIKQRIFDVYVDTLDVI